jgi:hypothetical protein
MYKFLTAVDPDARGGHIDAYRHYLRERDGELDVAGRKLSKREGPMLRFENVEPRYAMDHDAFAAHYASFDPRRAADAEMLLLLTMCKVNAAEAYGVEATFELAEQRALAHDDDLELRVLIEEHYHTRILLSAACEYGIRVSHAFQPPLSLRGLIGSITTVPLPLTFPLVLASELVFTVVFSQVFVKAGEVLAHRPELRDRIQERIVEILIDELGHVTFNQLRLSAWGMFQARRLFPMVALGMRNMCKEWAPLGIRTSTDLGWFERLPAEVMRRAFVVREAAAYSAAAAE